MVDHVRPRGWRTSTRCEAQNCVEVAEIDKSVAVRSNVLPDIQVRFAGPAWQAFIDGLKNAQY